MSEPKSLGTVLVVGGCGFVGAAVVDQLLNFPSENDLPPYTAEVEAEQTRKRRRKDGSYDTTVNADTQFPRLRGRYPEYSAQGTKVHALDLRCPSHRQLRGCEYHECDITDAEALLKVFSQVKPEVVINTASPHFDAKPDILKKVNIEGTRTLVEVASGRKGDWGGKCKAFVHTSSSSVVHDTLSDLINADERYTYVLPNTREYYSETKVWAEMMVLEENEKGQMMTCAVRPAGVIGEGDRAGFAYSVALTGLQSSNWVVHLQLGQGQNMFDLTYVGNVAHGLLCAAEALLVQWQRRRDGKGDVLDFERVDGEAFNVTNDEPSTFWDASRFVFSACGHEIDMDKVWRIPGGMCMMMGACAELVSKVTGKKTRLSRQTVRYSMMTRYFSCEKLRRRTGYKPGVSVEEGLQRTVKWMKQERQQEAEKKSQ